MKRLQLLLSVASVLAVLALATGAGTWWILRGTLPPLDGEARVAGLSGPVKVERDALGVPTISAPTRADVARALGFLHAQDRFFQMDLLRRDSAGELAELFGEAAVPRDRSHRVHGFRPLAGRVVAALPADRRAELDAYTAGVNAGLAALPGRPWEYLVLRTTPEPWRPEDSLLVGYTMWLDLQDSTGRLEQSLRAVRLTLGQAGLDFFAPPGDSWDAALDGSQFAPPPLPPLRLRSAGEDDRAAVLSADHPPAVGSNAFALSGAHTATGAAMLANDMHLGLRVPTVWYRAVFQWPDGNGGQHRVAGVTLPGTPCMTVGSNGRIAWGFTNAYVDTADVVLAETDGIAQIHYRTARGWVEIEDRPETIRVKGADPVPFTARWTEWGPIIAGPTDGRYLVLRWNAHDAASANLNLIELETAASVPEAVRLAPRLGVPNQNLVVAGADGAIAWTVAGTVPRRVGYDGRQPVSWAFGDRKWDGWLAPADRPVVTDPADGFIWTANQRLVGGDALARLGDGGYDGGARGRQIRDDLRALVAAGRKAVPADLLAVQLDDRAVFLERWQQLLLAQLTDEAVGRRRSRGELRDAVRAWSGRAAADSAAYRLVRAYRQHVTESVLTPFFKRAEAEYPRFSFGKFHYEDAVWRLVQEKPARLLDPAHPSWDHLLLAAADAVIADADEAGLPLARMTWGAHNTLHMPHPFSRFLPGPLDRWLAMPAEPLPGDTDMPRVQSPTNGASMRMVVSPGHEEQGLFHMPGGQSGHPLSPFYRAGHAAWVKGEPTPLLPGPTRHTLVLRP
ncbi:MAG: penicillin acylase family protein [Opitutaceae bacterium]|nr:penicillin acylase family protein [Opitutaceae bacterium]